MKPRCLLLVCILLSHSLFSQTSLQVKVGNLNQGTAYLWNTNTTSVDTISIQNGSFAMTYDLDEPTLFYLKIAPFNEFDRPIRLLLSSAETVLSIDSLKVAVRGNKWQELHPNQPEFIKDPNRNDLLYRFQKEWITFSDSVTSLTGDNPQDHILLDKRRQLYNAYIESTEQLMLANPDKVASAAALYEFLIRNNLATVEMSKRLYSTLDDSVRYSLIGVKIGQHINSEVSLQIGASAPEYKFTDINGNIFKAKDFRGQKVILHFWASICGPCRIENKAVVQFAISNKDIVIINVSVDANKEKWVTAIQKDGLGAMVNTCDLKGTNSEMAEALAIHGIPAYYLIDETGTILARGSLDEMKALFEN